MNRIFLIAFVTLILGGNLMAQPLQPGKSQPGYGIGEEEAHAAMSASVLDHAKFNRLVKNDNLVLIIQNLSANNAKLEIVAHQQKEIKAITNKFSGVIENFKSELKREDLPLLERRKLEFKLSEAEQEFRTKIMKVLLPHQLEMIAKCDWRQNGFSKLATNSIMGDELGLTAEQKKRIEEKSHQLAMKIEEFIHDTRQEARDIVLDEMTEKQQEKLIELTGEKNMADYFQRTPISILFPHLLNVEKLEKKPKHPAMLIFESDVKLRRKGK